jgi:zinc protease
MKRFEKRPDRWLKAAVLFVALLAVRSVALAALPIQTWTTANGARVLFVEAPSIPMLDLEVDFDAGSRLDPSAKSGLAAMTQALLALGAGGLTESQIAERLAFIGAQRGGGVSDDRASFTLRTLTRPEQLSAAIDLSARILSMPAFPAEVLERERARAIQALEEAQTKPATIASRAYSALLYPNHPYGVQPQPQTYAAITRDDLVQFHRARYGAARAVVSMIGAISREQAQAIAEQLTRGLPAGDSAVSMPAVVRPQQAAQRRISHPATQSHILIGMPGIARGDPDYFALTVGNYVLGGGGFVSRLYNEVREKRGLAYSVYSYFSPQMQSGPFTVGLQTQREQTDVALQVVMDSLAHFLEDGPTEAELKAAKANLVGGFALRIDSNRKILDNLAAIGFYNLPLDWLDKWTERVERVTLEQVRAAFARHVRLDQLQTVVVGAGDAPAKP